MKKRAIKFATKLFKQGMTFEFTYMAVLANFPSFSTMDKCRDIIDEALKISIKNN